MKPCAALCNDDPDRALLSPNRNRCPVTAAVVSGATKASWNFDTDGPGTTNAATGEKRPRLSPEERAAQVEFIRSLNK